MAETQEPGLNPARLCVLDREQLWRARDGFIGTVVGYYITREGHDGVVLQQEGTTVVHIYREAAIKTVDP